MAVALNQLRHVATIPTFNEPWAAIEIALNYRQGCHAGCHQMALAEQQLDESQYARFAASLAFREVEPESNLDLIQIEREDL